MGATGRIRAPGGGGTCGPSTGGGPEFRLADGPTVVSFASNDYLGLSQHPAVIAAATAALRRWGTGAGSSRLIVGDRPVHAELEATLAAWRATEAALVLPSGYQANLAVLTTFGAGARIVSDELNHASIIDGARLARAEVCVYRHGDVDHAAAPGPRPRRAGPSWSPTPCSPWTATSPRWPSCRRCAPGAGPCSSSTTPTPCFRLAPVDPAAACLRVGTLSKTLGSLGGYVAGPTAWIDLLVNRARSFIFTTGLAPADAAAAWPPSTICRSAEGAALRRPAARPRRRLRPGHPSPIVPVVLGDEAAALAAADDLLDAGPAGAGHPPADRPRRHLAACGSALSAAHREQDVARLRRASTPWSPPRGRPVSRSPSRRLVVVTGTGTEVGKTWVAAGLARRPGRPGPRASPPASRPSPSSPATLLHRRRRPGRGDRGGSRARSAHRIRWYPLAMAPPMAAAALGMPPPTLDALAGEVTAGWPIRAGDVGLVEGAGGVARPSAIDGDNADLVRALAADIVVLVADAGLGMINPVRLACRALEPVPVLVHLNRFDPADELHRRNVEWLRERDGLTVTTDVEDLAARLGAPAT